MNLAPHAGRLCAVKAFDSGNPSVERNTRWVIALTVLTMLAEIAGGWIFNSMALLADGWHMSSHALALGLSAFAYAAARRFSQDRRFAFGTWKIEILAGYTSAVLLVGVAALMLFQSVERLLVPMPIRYEEAIAIACLGLLVNLVSAWLLRDSPHQHEHAHHAHAGHAQPTAHGEHAAHRHHDLNQRSAYVHVIADAATSALAIVALFGGKFLHLTWLDPLMGIAGAGLVSVWAWGLLRDSGRVLLDAEMDTPVVAEVREAVAALPFEATLTDLHVWRVGKENYACIVSIATSADVAPEEVRYLLGIHQELAHITVEISRTRAGA